MRREGQMRVLRLPKPSRLQKLLQIVRQLGNKHQESTVLNFHNRTVDEFIALFCDKQIRNNGENAPLIENQEALAILQKAIAPLKSKLPFVEISVIEKIRQKINRHGYTKIAQDEQKFDANEKYWIYGFDYKTAANLFYQTNITNPENRIVGFIHTLPRVIEYIPFWLENAFVLFHIVLAIYRSQWNENVISQTDEIVIQQK